VAIPGIASGELRRSYDVVIVGAGIQGLALGYELTKLGIGDVCVLDAGYPGSGASGRNGELIRSAFNSTEWARLFDASLRRWHDLSVELDFNVLFTQAGYLVVATTEDELARCAEGAASQRRLGVASELIGAREVAELAPEIDPAVVAGGVFQEQGGYAHHDAAVWGYARAASRQGAEVHPSTRVTAIEVRAGRVSGVATSRGNVATRVVVDAAGGHAREVAAMAGVAIPTSSLRLEAFVTESLRPFLRPSIALLHFRGYAHQTTRGELVAGTEQAVMEPSSSLGSTLGFIRDAAQKFVRVMPRLAGVRVIRQWAGIVDVSPDLAPVLGPVEGCEGLFLDCGWVYGFMGAPAAGMLLARAIATGELSDVVSPFQLRRFREGRHIVESSLVVAPQ
jgi:heterotetrameric sarcosine oxidase beta subunit